MLRLACPMCCQWSVSFTDHQEWTAPDSGGVAVDFLVGQCDRCQSIVLTAPSAGAVATATARVEAMRAADDGR